MQESIDRKAKVKSKSATNNKKDVENNVEEISVLPPSPEAPDAEIEEAKLVEIHGDVEEELDFACEDSDTEEDEFTRDFLMDLDGKKKNLATET